MLWRHVLQTVIPSLSIGASDHNHCVWVDQEETMTDTDVPLVRKDADELAARCFWMVGACIGVISVYISASK